MKLTNWRFALAYGAIFLLGGIISVLEQHSIGLVFRSVMIGVGGAVLSSSARTCWQDKGRRRRQPPH